MINSSDCKEFESHENKECKFKRTSGSAKKRKSVTFVEPIKNPKKKADNCENIQDTEAMEVEDYESDYDENKSI